LNKPRSATYTYPLAIGHHTRPYIQSTTQQRHDRSRVGTTLTIIVQNRVFSI
jgi:hypothetical protein